MRQRFQRPPHADHLNQILANEGYIGCSPLQPTVAISFSVLEAYRQQHRVCPRFSIQAQVKALCHIQEVHN